MDVLAARLRKRKTQITSMRKDKGDTTDSTALEDMKRHREQLDAHSLMT